jgi:hypothetical protein
MRTSIIILPAILAPLAEAFAPVSAITVGRCHSETSASVLGMAKDEESNVMNRRNMFSFVAVATASSILGVERATALDMDAFMNSQVRSDSAGHMPYLFLILICIIHCHLHLEPSALLVDFVSYKAIKPIVIQN